MERYSLPFKNGKVDAQALIGMVVYLPYTPQSPGVVVDVAGHHPLGENYQEGRWRRVRVKWLKKGQPETTEEIIHLRFLKDLIGDHEQKLENARKLYARCEKEIEVPKGVK